MAFLWLYLQQVSYWWAYMLICSYRAISVWQAAGRRMKSTRVVVLLKFWKAEGRGCEGHTYGGRLRRGEIKGKKKKGLSLTRMSLSWALTSKLISRLTVAKGDRQLDRAALLRKQIRWSCLSNMMKYFNSKQKYGRGAVDEEDTRFHQQPFQLKNLPITAKRVEFNIFHSVNACYITFICATPTWFRSSDVCRLEKLTSVT